MCDIMNQPIRHQTLSLCTIDYKSKFTLMLPAEDHSSMIYTFINKVAIINRNLSASMFCVFIKWLSRSFSRLCSPSALDTLWFIWDSMPPATSPTSSSCAYRKLCRARTTSTCTSCSTRSLQVCRFFPRQAQMAAAAAVSPLHLHHLFVYTSVTIPSASHHQRPWLSDALTEFL